MTLQLLRDNKDSLMNVLDAFLHDPLVEWEDEKRKLVSEFVSPPVSYSDLLLTWLRSERENQLDPRWIRVCWRATR